MQLNVHPSKEFYKNLLEEDVNLLKENLIYIKANIFCSHLCAKNYMRIVTFYQKIQQRI